MIIKEDIFLGGIVKTEEEAKYAAYLGLDESVEEYFDILINKVEKILKKKEFERGDLSDLLENLDLIISHEKYEMIDKKTQDLLLKLKTDKYMLMKSSPLVFYYLEALKYSKGGEFDDTIDYTDAYNAIFKTNVKDIDTEKALKAFF